MWDWPQMKSITFLTGEEESDIDQSDNMFEN